MMLNQLLSSEPGALAALGVALLIGARSLRNRLRHSRGEPATNEAERAPQRKTQLANLKKVA